MCLSQVELSDVHGPYKPSVSSPRGPSHSPTRSQEYLHLSCAGKEALDPEHCCFPSNLGVRFKTPHIRGDHGCAFPIILSHCRTSYPSGLRLPCKPAFLCHSTWAQQSALSRQIGLQYSLVEQQSQPKIVATWFMAPQLGEQTSLPVPEPEPEMGCLKSRDWIQLHLPIYSKSFRGRSPTEE